jgi:WD40 repeat protein/predicted Zn-dependent peptidase
MSPEQARGEPLDGRSDLFALGCVLYEMATGVSPFRADSTIATLRRVIDDPAQPMASLNPELPPWFCAVVDRLLQKDPAHRFNSAQEVSDLLEKCLAHLQQPAAVPLPAALVPQTTGRLRNFNSWKGVIAVLATLGVALLGIFLGQAPDAGPTSFVLPNGLRVRLVPEPDPGEVSLLLAVPAGILNEGKGQAHLAHITEHATVFDLADAPLAGKVERWHRKGEVNAETLGEFMYFDLSCTRDELPAALAIEAARLGNVKYTAATLEREIPRALAEVEHLIQQPDAMGKFALVPFAQAAFHAQTKVPFRRQTEKIGIDDVRSFHDRWFRVDSSVLIVVGDFDVAQTRKVIEDRFGSLAKPKDPLPSRPALTPGKRRVQWDVPKRHWFISWPLPQVDSPDYAALHLVSQVLQGRLANSPPLVQNDFDRVLVVGCEAPTEESFDALRKQVVAEVDRLAQPGGLDEMELRSCCNELEEYFLKTDLDQVPLPPGISRTMARGNVELQRLSVEIVAGDFDRFLTKMKAVSPEAAAAAVRKWLAADRACIVEVVPAIQTAKTDVRLVWFPRFSPDSKWLITAHGSWDAKEGGEVRVWEAETGKPKFTIPAERGVRTVAWAPKGEFFVSGDYGGAVLFYDAETGEQTGKIQLPRNVEVLQIAPDEKRLYAASGDGSVRIWELPSRKELHTWKGLHKGNIWGMALSPDGLRLCTAGKDDFARVLDVETFGVLHEFAHPADVNGVVFTDDGKHVLTGCGDAAIRVFDVASGKEVGRLGGHKQGSVTDLCFAPGGKLLASCGMDGSVRLWDFADFANPKQTETFDGANDQVFGVAISPDGKWLAFGGWSDQIRVIDLDTHEAKWSWQPEGQAKGKKPAASR